MNETSTPSGRSAPRFAKSPRPFTPLTRALPLALAAIFSALAAQATPYASSLTNSGGTISFRLNESADGVKILSDGGATVTDLGPLAEGLHNIPLVVSGTFQVSATKASPAGYATGVAPNRGAILQIGTDTLLTRFNQPRGLAVNTDPSSPAFGRVYVANGVAGTTTNSVFGANRTLGDGIYLLNPDLSDALGLADTASTGGLDWVAGGTASPYRLSIGQDGNLYVADWSDANGSLYVTDADVSSTSGFNVLGGPKGSPFPVTATRFHGSIAAAVVEGSLALGTLTAYVIDEDLQPDRATTTQNARNTLWRHDIGATLPGPEAVPTRIGSTTPWINFASQTMDLSRGTNGYFYVNNYRSAGTDRGGVYVLDAAGTPLWNSLAASTAMGFANDQLRATGGGAVSPRGDYIAVINLESNAITVVPLIEGIPDLTNRLVFHGFGASSPQGRDVAFDIAGNIYAISQGAQALRVFSPGGTTTAITGSDGSFDLVRPPSVSVVATDFVASENAADTATFSIYHSGNIDSALTVFFTLSGTAVYGFDYETDLLSAVIPAGATNVEVIITATDDSIAELSESVTLTLTGSSAYDLKTPASATIDIVDNEFPNVVTITPVDAVSFEGSAPSDTLSFLVTRYGDTNSDPLIFISADVGTAISDANPEGDFMEPPTGLFLGAGVVSQVFTITVLNDNRTEGSETVGLRVTAGGDVVPGTPDTAFGTIRDDDYAPACVLFTDDFEADSSANWIVQFGANNGILDATTTWAYDYSVRGIPSAPHSVGGSTRGVFVAVNKNDATVLGSAGLNLYPAGRTFSGNYALRFDMFLSLGVASSTEHALAGLNHSTLATNRVTQSVDTNNTTRGGDGIWAAIESDGSGNRDYAAYTTTNANNPPVLLTNRAAGAFSSLITAPPYAFPGSPGNGTATPRTWAEVELSQFNNLITLKVNNVLIYELTNNTAYTSGNVMIGMNDQFDSIGAADNFVIFDNLVVVNLDFIIKSIVPMPENQVQIDFVSPLGGSVSDFHLQSATDPAPGNWVDDETAVITATADGFRVVTTRSGDHRFYKIRR